MIETLPLVQQWLQRRLSGTMRAGDIFLTGDLDEMPSDVMLPALGIKDGQVKHRELAGGMIEYTLQVQLMIWIEVFKEQEALIGRAGKKGILEIEHDIDIALDEYKFESAEITSSVKVTPSPESQPANDGTRTYQRKKITYEIIKQTTRPSAARGG